MGVKIKAVSRHHHQAISLEAVQFASANHLRDIHLSLITNDIVPQKLSCGRSLPVYDPAEK